MFRLSRYLKGFRKEVLLGPLFKLTEAVFELIVPIVMAAIIDTGIANRDQSYVLWMGGLLLALGLVGLGCSLTCQYFAARASQGFGTVVRNELFDHINTLSHSELDYIGTPSLITRITNDVNQLQVAVAMLIRLVIRAPFLVIGSTVMAMLLDWKLACVFLAAAPLLALALYLVMSRSAPFFRSIQQKLDRISLLTRESLSGTRVIRAFSRQEREEQRFFDAADDLSQTSVQVGRISALLNPVTYAIANLSIVAILWFGGMRVDSGALSQGEVIAFVNYMTQILLALVVVANLVVIFTKASASAARVNEALALSPSVESPENSAPLPIMAQPPLLELDHVSFSYHGAQSPAVRNICLTVTAGQAVGIIGGTGSGKSSLVSLIPRFYDATEGSVRVNGVDVREWGLAALRAKIGVVPQKAVLFSGTVRDNLLWGSQAADGSTLERALEIAQAAEMVSRMPGGLDARIEQGGGNLSGGQKQRLTIARALVMQPDILILDDSSSALDLATDAALRRALRAWSRDNGCTVLMISQRVSTVRDCDQILVLDDGEAAGLGTHRALLDSCEVYQEICRSQHGGEEEPA